jgi:hypothetical protein
MGKSGHIEGATKISGNSSDFPRTVDYPGGFLLGSASLYDCSHEKGARLIVVQ